MNTIRLITVCDEKFVPHLGTMIYSLWENKRCKNPILIYIIENNLKASSKELLSIITNKFSFKIEYFKIDTSIYDWLVTIPRLTQAVYYRLSIPELFSEEISKVIYIDSDTIFTDDISTLWSIDISDYYIACAKDILMEMIGEEHKRKLSMELNEDYFNAGVMVMNLDKWRADNISQKTIDFVSTHADIIQACEQDWLNYVLQGKVKFISPKFNNVMTGVPWGTYYKEYRKSEIQEAIKYPVIIHYINRKPSEIGWFQRERKKYFYYRQKTPWKMKKTEIIKLSFFNKIFWTLFFLDFILNKTSFYTSIKISIKRTIFFRIAQYLYHRI